MKTDLSARDRTATTLLALLAPAFAALFVSTILVQRGKRPETKPKRSWRLLTASALMLGAGVVASIAAYRMAHWKAPAPETAALAEAIVTALFGLCAALPLAVGSGIHGKGRWALRFVVLAFFAGFLLWAFFAYTADFASRVAGVGGAVGVVTSVIADLFTPAEVDTPPALTKDQVVQIRANFLEDLQKFGVLVGTPNASELANQLAIFPPYR